MSGSVQISGQDVDSEEVKDLTDSIKNDEIRLLSLRECRINDRDYKRLIKAIGPCKSLVQLSLNVDILTDKHRVDLLAQMLQKNRSLVGLFIHGNPLGDDGMEVIAKALSQHPYIVSLDVGDCSLTDRSIQFISDLLPPNGPKSGLRDLTISANPGITTKGWAQLSIAIAANSSLRSFYVDYNMLGDYCGSCLVVAFTAHRGIEIIDMEGCGITEHTAQLLLHLVRNFPVKLKTIVLDENKISMKTIESIQTFIGDTGKVVAESDESEEEAKPKPKRPSSATKLIEVKVRPVKPQILHGGSPEKKTKERADEITDEKEGDFTMQPSQERPSSGRDANLKMQGRESPTERETAMNDGNLQTQQNVKNSTYDEIIHTENAEIHNEEKGEIETEDKDTADYRMNKDDDPYDLELSEVPV